MTLGRIGVWSSAFAVAPATEARRAVREMDELGYDALWYPEGLGTEVRDWMSTNSWIVSEIVIAFFVGITANSLAG